ncbi:MAG: NADH-quinone oxidoreductase subunit NuoH [Pirellulales bacterium]
MAEFINIHILHTIAAWFGGSVAVDALFGYIAAAVLKAVVILNIIAVGALFFIWLERKVSGRIQDRLGPTRVGGKFGWLQTLADGLKLITKEDLMPGDADGLLFRLAPYIAFCASFAAYLALPFAAGWAAIQLNVAVFFILAVLGMEVFGVILAGYASASKWSLFGAMREAAQVVSYEVPLGLCVVIPVTVAGTMDLTKIGELQAGWFTNWYVFHSPMMLITAGVFFTCCLASVNRAPFDLAEAESELVAGFHTEYSGLRWSFFFMAEYGSMFLVSGLAAALFFGGWNGPIPITHILGIAGADGVAGFIAQLMGATNMLIKMSLGVTIMIWIRWTLPRLRIDQVMTTCWKYCTPIACVMFVGVLLWQAFQLPTAGRLAPMQVAGDVEELLPPPPTEAAATASWPGHLAPANSAIAGAGSPGHEFGRAK